MNTCSHLNSGGTLLARFGARVVAACGVLLVLAACANKPPVPDWQLNAHDAAQRATSAYLAGDERVALAEWSKAEQETSRTGQPAVLARLGLMRCAARVASLSFGPCEGFERWQAEAAPSDAAYNAYLRGTLKPGGAELALLPESQRPAAQQPNAASLQAIADPLSRLVAAAVMLQSGNASPQVIELALEAASSQGWRRPLLAWLGVAHKRAVAGGASEAANALQRRMDAVLGAASGVPPGGAKVLP